MIITMLFSMTYSMFSIYVIPLFLCLTFILPSTWSSRTLGQSTGKVHLSETERAKAWLAAFNTSAERMHHASAVAYWNYVTNISDQNQAISDEAEARLSIFLQEASDNASFLNLSLIHDARTKRLMSKVCRVGVKLNASDNIELSALIGRMTSVYSTATICSMKRRTHQTDCSRQWSLTPELTNIMTESIDYELLKYVWESWRDVSGKPIRSIYKKFVDLSNRGARSDDFDDTGSWWRFAYEDPFFESQVERLWYEVLPLYEQLYAYVRKSLRRIYGPEKIKNVLPAHVLGNMWSQEWSGVLSTTIPYRGKQSIDVTQAMVQQDYTPLRMFRLADEFFQSLGLMPLPPSFYNDSMLEKPQERPVVCHALAVDFMNRRDYRIKMCTQVSMKDLVTIHHEMGHTQYSMHYAHQPVTFREGANPGFHEAIGDAVALSAATPKHLRLIGLLKNYQPDREQDINFLYKKALEKIAFLPFGYLIDQWRWKVFSGEYAQDRWNEAWWRLSYKYQGLKPPSQRSEEDFDPGAKFHVASNVPYIRYFVSYILQFQFYHEMCKAANHTGPLHQCDFYQNRAAGEVLAKAMRMGSSKPWQEVMEAMTGHRNMSAQPLIDYFQPLIDWLKQRNQGECFGWGYQWPPEVMKLLPTRRCPPD